MHPLCLGRPESFLHYDCARMRLLSCSLREVSTGQSKASFLSLNLRAITSKDRSNSYLHFNLFTKNIYAEAWRCSSVVECLPNMHEALGLIPNIIKREVEG